jgi:hypothetical protein
MQKSTYNCGSDLRKKDEGDMKRAVFFAESLQITGGTHGWSLLKYSLPYSWTRFELQMM